MNLITAYGLVAVSFMMLMYALERRDRRFVLGFALGCLLSSAYGFLSGAWPFGLVEAVWSVVALRRYATSRGQNWSASASSGYPPGMRSDPEADRRRTDPQPARGTQQALGPAHRLQRSPCGRPHQEHRFDVVGLHIRPPSSWSGSPWPPSDRSIRPTPIPFPFLLFLGNVTQLLLVFVILVGQGVLGKAADKRALQTYEDAEEIFKQVTVLHDQPGRAGPDPEPWNRRR